MDGVALTVENYLIELTRILGPTYAFTPSCPGYRDCRDLRVYRYFSLPLAGRAPYRLGLPQIDLSLKHIIQKEKFDLVHAHSPFSAGKAALRLARQREIPIVATFHTKYRDSFMESIPFSPVVDWAIRKIIDFFESVDQVWAPTEECLETLREYGYRGSVEVVRHGIDLAPPAQKETLRARGGSLLGIDPNEFVLLYVGQQAWEKNLALLIQSLGLLKRMNRRFKMIFVGEGYAARKMKALIKTLGLSEMTTFTGVVRDRTSLSALYARADLFLFPSVFDTSGLVVKEAAAFGVPSVVIRGSAAAEEVDDGINGFTTDNSTSAYAAKLANLIANPRTVVRAGEAARLSLYRSWKEVVEEVKDRYIHITSATFVSCSLSL